MIYIMLFNCAYVNFVLVEALIALEKYTRARARAQYLK